ncbi:60s ribosomal protein, mitochondrial precursor, putative [Candida dubliniensis CD36]|uniref:60s ribosomal protein, mitochondrial, putative n=1 Tax=Candida dubliniensis (strain CD36 / ATCC MYA-646 / CBS 7987 / NCPF 3949 / NRRL Y-17841) TaxID=573826 RepID=B9WKP6_CANDC|nr:mitochondrial 54S ribosomal protein YmL16 [Candida dubliniensis CD36]CAX39594.1 60s ribosomal protein, mitochondrial precursor, putative [Candida dubliniensis CD36]
MFTATRSATTTASFCRLFSSSTRTLSNIGKKPIKLYEGVNYSIESIPLEFCKKFTKRNKTFILDRQIITNGPLGKLRVEIPEFINISQTNNENDKSIIVSVKKPENKIQRSLWGTYRSILYNNIIGITEGHLSIVKFVGTGYRAILEKDEKTGEDIISLKIGLPFTPKLKIPKGLKVSSPNPARLVIEGSDKQQVKLFAAFIREHKKPEPYKGKGIFVDDEKIVLKQRKVK